MCFTRVRSSALLLLMCAIVGSTSGCAWLPWAQKPKLSAEEKARREKHRELEQKALEGDRTAARKLAKWHYTHDENNERTRYWLRVAERNGDKASGQLADQMEGWR